MNGLKWSKKTSAREKSGCGGLSCAGLSCAGLGYAGLRWAACAGPKSQFGLAACLETRNDCATGMVPGEQLFAGGLIIADIQLAEQG